MATPTMTPDSMCHERRRLRWGMLLLPVLVVLSAWLLCMLPLIKQFNLHFQDMQRSLAAREHYFDEVVVVDIDERSLRELRPYLGDWPYQRGVYALIREYLAEQGSGPVVFDMLFADAREGDALFREHLLRQGNTILAATALSADTGADSERQLAFAELAWPAGRETPALHWTALSLPNPLLTLGMNGHSGIGIISVLPDDDGVLRKVPLLHEVQGHYFPALPLASLAARRQAGNIGFQADTRQLSIGMDHWPVDRQGMVSLHFPRNANAVRALSFAHLAHAALGLPESELAQVDLRGKTIYIGGTAFLTDRVNTPLGAMAGTYLLALTEQLLAHGLVLESVPDWLNLALLMLALAPLCVVLIRRIPISARAERWSFVWTALLLDFLHWMLLFNFRLESALFFHWLVLGLAFVAYLLHRQFWLRKHSQRLLHDKLAADAANQAKSLFLANMSHEIRTPMNAIIGFTDLCLLEAQDQRQRDYLEKVSSSAHNLLRIINDVLDFSKIEAGRLEIEQAPFDFGKLLSGLGASIGVACEGKGLEFLIDVSPGTPEYLIGDAVRINQILSNLLNNAVKFTEQGMLRLQVVVQARAGERIGLGFAVSDTGIGLSKAELERLFQPFVQADASTTRRFGGTGLGLSICKRLVESLGGEISVSSIPGQGSRFEFTLWLGLQPDEPGLSEALPKPGRVVVLDPSPRIAQQTAAYLSDLGWQVDRLGSYERLLPFLLAAQAACDPVGWVVLDIDALESQLEALIGLLHEEGSLRTQPGLLGLLSWTAARRWQNSALARQVTVVHKPLTPFALRHALRPPPARQELAAPTTWPMLAGLKVLLVEDNRLNRQLALALLQRVGIETSLAENGEEAVRAVAMQTFDLVLMDVQMPVMDGLEATRTIRARSECAALPIIAMTANAMSGDRERCLAAGMNDHLPKPIDARLLYRTLVAWRGRIDI